MQAIYQTSYLIPKSDSDARLPISHSTHYTPSHSYHSNSPSSLPLQLPSQIPIQPSLNPPSSLPLQLPSQVPIQPSLTPPLLPLLLPQPPLQSIQIPKPKLHTPTPPLPPPLPPRITRRPRHNRLPPCTRSGLGVFLWLLFPWTRITWSARGPLASGWTRSWNSRCLSYR